MGDFRRLFGLLVLSALLVGGGALGLRGLAHLGELSPVESVGIQNQPVVELPPVSASAAPALESTATKSRTVTFAYDSANRLVSQTERGGAQVIFQFDAAGNPVTVTTSYTLFAPQINR